MNEAMGLTAADVAAVTKMTDMITASATVVGGFGLS